MTNARSVPIPTDDEAEQVAVGFALGDPGSAAAGAAVLTGADFYDPALGRIFDAAVQLDGVAGTDRRVLIVASATGVSPARLDRLCSGRPAIRDPSGLWARRVRASARRRRVMALAATLHSSAARGTAAELYGIVDELADEIGVLRRESVADAEPAVR